MFYKVIRFLVGIWVRIWFRYRIEDRPDPLPDQRIILAATHTSAIDIIALAVAWPRQVHFIAKKEIGRKRFFHWAALKLGVIFIDRQANDLESMRKSLAILNEERCLGIFPEGTRTHNVDPKNMKVGVAFLAFRAKSDVVPVSIESSFRFRAPLTVRFKPLLSVARFQEMGSAQGREAMSLALYNQMYDTGFTLDDLHAGGADDH
ncbi:MAG: lysophospholipid acyltransferase family protein [Ndongobacter sp.]|nr:lysophospholipid acyltransferase family protein [Ndongobacter sp.]